MTRAYPSETRAEPAGAGPVPRHVAIIMDGNGRWAEQRGLPRVAGHRAGAEALRRTLKAAVAHGVEYLTVYAFSSENWRRTDEEIADLTEERRKELAKLVGQYAEKARIAVRNVRRDGMEHLKQDEKKHLISEDERKRLETEVQKLTDDTIKEIDEGANAKEKEILNK